MKTKNLLIAAAVSGALAAAPLLIADTAHASQGNTIERMGCNGKAGKGKDSCKGHDKQGKKGKKKGKDKSACAGKDGCGGKSGKGMQS